MSQRDESGEFRNLLPGYYSVSAGPKSAAVFKRDAVEKVWPSAFAGIDGLVILHCRTILCWVRAGTELSQDLHCWWSPHDEAESKSFIPPRVGQLRSEISATGGVPKAPTCCISGKYR